MIRDWTELSLGKSSAPERVAFVSDLHLFSNRSAYDDHHDAIVEVVRWADTVIWGGDLFDFRWSRLATADLATESAIDWLARWWSEYPGSRFVYLRGNHDVHLPFQAALAEWATDRERFDAGLDALQIADVLFLHGDVIEKGGSERGFDRYRRKWSGKRRAGNWHDQAYQAAVSLRIHVATAQLAHPPKRTCRRLARWIRANRRDDLPTIRRVVFGHTHSRIDGWEHADMLFYNGGAAIRHVGFQPVRLEIRE